MRGRSTRTVRIVLRKVCFSSPLRALSAISNSTSSALSNMLPICCVISSDAIFSSAPMSWPAGAVGASLAARSGCSVCTVADIVRPPGHAPRGFAAVVPLRDSL